MRVQAEVPSHDETRTSLISEACQASRRDVPRRTRCTTNPVTVVIASSSGYGCVKARSSVPYDARRRCSHHGHEPLGRLLCLTAGLCVNGPGTEGECLDSLHNSAIIVGYAELLR